MARYRTTVRTDLMPEEAFAYMADLRNFEEWDPGVRGVTQVDGEGGGPDASFDVVVDAPNGALTLRYETTEFEEPHRTVVRAESRMFTSLDRIEVEPDAGGALVTYDAELTLNGSLGIFDLLLRPAFNRAPR